MIKKEIFKIIGSKQRPILIDIISKKRLNENKVIVFSHGFKGFKDWGPFSKIAEHFALEGFIFVKFNFTHNGTTIDDPINFGDLDAFGNNNFSKELDDLNFVLDWIEGNLQSSKISLFGHSRGGGISMLKTAEDDRVSNVISWASPSDFTNRIPKDRIQLWKEKGVVFVYNGRTKQNMPMYYQFYEDCVTNKNRINIKNAINRIKIPQLIVHGNDDPTVKINEAENLKKWNPKAKMHIIDGADHVFGGFHPYNLEEFPAHLKEAVNVTIDFLKR